jgi:hypothetical protein
MEGGGYAFPLLLVPLVAPAVQGNDRRRQEPDLTTDRDASCVSSTGGIPRRPGGCLLYASGTLLPKAAKCQGNSRRIRPKYRPGIRWLPPGCSRRAYRRPGNLADLPGEPLPEFPKAEVDNGGGVLHAGRGFRSSHIGSENHVTKDRLLLRAGVQVVHILNSEVKEFGEKVVTRLLPRSITRYWEVEGARRGVNPFEYRVW